METLNHNYILGPVDTDSISFSKPDGAEFTEQEQKTLLNEINSLMLKGITYEHDGYYDTVVVIKAKNYVLKDKKGKIKYKGSGILDSKKEPALTELLEKLILDLIDTKGINSIYIYNEYIREALNIQDISRWATKKTVSKSVLNPTRTTEAKILSAIDLESVQEGDKVFLYTAIDGEKQDIKKGTPQTYKDGRPKMVPNRILKLITTWNHDEEKSHYLRRIWATTNILKNVIDMAKLPKYHLSSNAHLLEQFKE